ncbi:hypothetical protein [Carnobacterium gallinarum]|uniref:hypothetical protein n=1 Tax=Carnobacterium gallinarum TaxID=2749 RepID=UPI0014706B04|nr:hypothetical protein [Carnobacterium gallinarum]
MSRSISKKDYEISSEIERILMGDSVGQSLIIYFASLPDKNIRRGMPILARNYPDNPAITDEECLVILW